MTHVPQLNWPQIQYSTQNTNLKLNYLI